MRIWLFIALSFFAFPALGIFAQASGAQSLTIFAATSLTDVFEELRDTFRAAHLDVDILLNFSSSSTLAAQLNQGAPADIFASANERQMDLVVDSGIIKENAVQVFAHNQLVLITPVGNPASIKSIRDLAGEAILLVLAAEGTPIRAYTDAMFASYNDEYGDEFAERVMRNLVSEESNVRQVVTRVALGEADAGIVYQSDVIGNVGDQLLTFEIDPIHNQLASYPIAVLADSLNPTTATRFIDFILSQAARPIFSEYGFCTPAILTDAPPETFTPEPTLEAADDVETPNSACPAQPAES